MEQLTINRNSWHAKLWNQSHASRRYGDESDSCTYVRAVLLVMMKWLVIGLVIGVLTIAATASFVSMVITVDAGIHMIVAGVPFGATIRALMSFTPVGSLWQLITNTDTWVTFGTVWWVIVSVFAAIIALVALWIGFIRWCDRCAETTSFDDLAASKYLKKVCIRVKIGDQ
jgi:hypothetical protein